MVDPATVTCSPPETCVVRATASVVAGWLMSCSRTRYPTSDPEATFQVPTRLAAAPDAAGDPSASGAGARCEASSTVPATAAPTSTTATTPAATRLRRARLEANRRVPTSRHVYRPWPICQGESRQSRSGWTDGGDNALMPIEPGTPACRAVAPSAPAEVAWLLNLLVQTARYAEPALAELDASLLPGIA